MRKVQSLSLKYTGYEAPENKEEAEIEIAGLETVIASAYQRIAILKQGLKLIALAKSSVTKDAPNAQNISETNSENK